MSKYIHIVILALLAYLLVYVLLLRSCSHERTIKANLSTTELLVNEPFVFKDSTRGAKQWKWEFGNHDQLLKQEGEYAFAQAGKYRIKLTVDQKHEKFFVVNVTEKIESTESRLISVLAPKMAIQDEYIVFKSEGDANLYRWEFGETGLIDSREKDPIYAYAQPGTYEVMLTTDKNFYPIRHQIEIVPRYNDNDSTDVLTLIGIDIKNKLQALADGKTFNNNYNYVLSRYLCNNPNTMVIVNNNKYNDFYSYCQGLKITGKANKTAIERVVVDTNADENSSCLSVIYVMQNDRFKGNKNVAKNEIQ